MILLYKYTHTNTLLHLCAPKMRMEPLLFADENAPEWAFSKRKGVMLEFEIIQNNDDDIPIDYYYREGFLIPETGIKNTIWNSYIDYTDESDSFKLLAVRAVVCCGTETVMVHQTSTK